MSAKISKTMMYLLVAVVGCAGALAQPAATSQMGYHPEADKHVIFYTEGENGSFEVRDAATDAVVFNGSLGRPENYRGDQVNCQGNNPCLVGDLSGFTSEGDYIITAASGNLTAETYPFQVDGAIFSSHMGKFMEFFDAMEQRDSTFHADMNTQQDPSFLFMADGSFIAVADQAALPLIRLGSAYRRNPGLFDGEMRDHIAAYVDYLSGLQGVQIEELANGTGFRLNPGVAISNAFVPGPTDRESIKVYSSGSSPSLIAEVPVVSLCGADDGSAAWDDCMAHAETYYKCQADEPCLNLTYIEKTGTLSGHSGYAVSRGWDYEFGCFPDVPLSEPTFTAKPNPCMIFDPTSNREYTSMTLLAFLEAIPAIYDLSPAEAEELYTRSVDTYQHIKDNYAAYAPGDDDAGYFGAALFLLHDYSGNASYLEEAHGMRDTMSASLSADGTKGDEFYWEEYARHRQEITDAELEYPHNGQDPEQLFRGKIFGDYKDRGQYSISNNGERVFEYDHNIQFQNSRFMLTEGMFAVKAHDLIPSSEEFILDVAQSQLSWLTGMNAVQDGVALGSPLSSYSFIHGIGERFPDEFHSRLLLDTGYRAASGGEVIGARGTDLQWNNGSDYVYFDGKSEILGQELGALGNGYQGETKIQPYDRNKTFNNGKDHIPGWISGVFDVNTAQETDIIFNYRDNLDTYEYTETTSEMVATAVELFAYLDAAYNNRSAHAPVLLNGTTADGGNSSGGGDNSTSDDEPGENATSGCFDSIENIPATCEGGAMASDMFDGGRHITCSSGNNSLAISAWDKPSSNDPQHFEMYRQDATGTPPTICIGETCISDEGYKKSQNYPICIEQRTSIPPGENVTNSTQPPEENGTNSTSPSDGGDAAVILQAKEWFPQGYDMVWVCDADGATRYDYVLGDGDAQHGISNSDMWHTYPEGDASYTASCTARDSAGVLGTSTAVIEFSGGVGTVSANSSGSNQTPPGDGSGSNETNSTEPPGQEPACHSALGGLPANCTGTITEDTSDNSCRRVACEEGNDSISILACDKPDIGEKEYFEMYRQEHTENPPRICLGDTCIQDNGYAKSGQYPLCEA